MLSSPRDRHDMSKHLSNRGYFPGYKKSKAFLKAGRLTLPLAKARERCLHPTESFLLLAKACAPYTALEYLGLEADFDVHLAETLTALSSHPSLHR